MGEVLVRCGGAEARRPRGAQVLDLDVDAPAASASRVTLRLEHITVRMVETLPPVLSDLVEIACYVYCAGQFTRRDTPKMLRFGETWRRRFKFVVPVRDPAAWTRPEVVAALTNGL